LSRFKRLVKAQTTRLTAKLMAATGLDERVEQLLYRTELTSNASQGTQVLLRLHYRQLLERGEGLPSFDDVEFRVHSQNGEDGILLYLFSLLGAPTKKCIELCAGDGVQCNTANLIVNHGWRGLLVDGDEANIWKARRFHWPGRDTAWFPADIVQAWVTAENVNDLMQDHGFGGDVDLFSLDMDGIDYWVWKALASARPRVVVAEYNWTWGPSESKTVPYDPHFRIPSERWTPDGDHLYFGASLQALTKLARAKGYRLVGCQRWGFNAFFVQDGVGEKALPAVSPEECFDTPVMHMRWTPQHVERTRAKGAWVSV
jgi:hypothetical protein